MEVIYYKILPLFNTVGDGLNYLTTSPYKFSFIADSVAYNHMGNIIPIPDNSETILINELAIDIKEKTDYLSPGHLYIKDGFIEYYKEIR